MDGFGRKVAINSGYGAGIVVTALNTIYAPCGCSPLGKLSQQSEPAGWGATEI